MENQEREKDEGEARAGLPKSRLKEIWSSYSRRLKQIDELEKRTEDRAKRTRRRLTHVMCENSEYRRTHSRMFVSHQFLNSRQNPSTFKLIVEGRLLIDNLDHEGAANVDKRIGTGAPSVFEPRYRLMGDPEEEPVEPAAFTHLFDEMKVEFQTVYQPIQQAPPVAPVLPPKKSRSGKRKAPATAAAKQEEPLQVDPSQCKASGVQTLKWSKSMSEDSNAFVVFYPNHYSERPPPPGFKFHFVASTITLHPSRPEPVYKPSTELANAFFPKHLNDKPQRKRVKLEGGGVGEMAASKSVAFENDIYVPAVLTLDEVVHALYQYVIDKHLIDPNDNSQVNCDRVLTELLDHVSFNFSSLEEILLSKNLATRIQPREEPIVVTYIMKRIAPPPEDLDEKAMKVFLPGSSPLALTFDINVTVRGLFHYRVRELLRRVKRREFEYTSARTKARYLLVARKANEDLIKVKLEAAATGRGYDPANIPIFLALAKAALPDSEARISSQIDAKMCALLQRLDETTRSAEMAWDTVNLLLECGNKKKREQPQQQQHHEGNEEKKQA